MEVVMVEGEEGEQVTKEMYSNLSEHLS